MPGTVVGPTDAVMNETDPVTVCFVGLKSGRERQLNVQSLDGVTGTRTRKREKQIKLEGAF